MRQGQRAKGIGHRQGVLPLSLLPLLLTFALCPLPFALTGCSSSSTRFLSIATGGTGGVYYPYGGAIARLISENIPNTQATAEVTGASVDNLKLLQVGKVDLAFTLADSLAEGVRGTGPFKATGPIGSVRTLAVLYTNFTHIVVRKGSGIRSLADLRGRDVSVGAPGSGTELIADRILNAAGIDPRRDITRYALSVTESAGSLKDGKIDALFWSGGLPTAAIRELAATPGLSIDLLRSDDVLPALQRDYGRGLYELAVIPGATYAGIEGDRGTVGVKNLLVASSQLDVDLVAEILRVIYQNKEVLVAAHPEARHLERPVSFDNAPAPYHPGAVRYFGAVNR